ncbi:unnamed protein product [Gongylonema pulchrum]|uniref:Uncharacterized protein n=1 Tax=Gongylonema pulchrum TaxID=637853 RepID=A0A3P7NZE1_9BILA|nr:unnamed protein product [Gongylonema pulchrum]
MADRLRQHIPAIRAVQALEKAKFYTPNDDFQSVLFNKFVTNSKLERYVDQVCDSTPRVSHVATQTDFLPQRMLASVEEELQSSNGNCFLSMSDSFLISLFLVDGFSTGSSTLDFFGNDLKVDTSAVVCVKCWSFLKIAALKVHASRPRFAPNSAADPTIPRQIALMPRACCRMLIATSTSRTYVRNPS